MNDIDTSIRAAVDCPGGGRIVTMGFPGLEVDVFGTAHVNPAYLIATLDDPRLTGCALVLALAETTDLPHGALSTLELELRLREMKMAHLPIVDYGAPSTAFDVQWRRYAPICHEELDKGGAIGLTCHYGAGRSGTIAARLLIDRGLSPKNAIKTMRAAFAESIESDAQVAWLEAT